MNRRTEETERARAFKPAYFTPSNAGSGDLAYRRRLSRDGRSGNSASILPFTVQQLKFRLNLAFPKPFLEQGLL